MEDYPYDYPHTTILQMNFSTHRKNPDGSLFPSAISGGNASVSFVGDTYEESLEKARDFFRKNNIIHNEKN
jgi:hypothetical protein